MVHAFLIHIHYYALILDVSHMVLISYIIIVCVSKYIYVLVNDIIIVGVTQCWKRKFQKDV